MTDLKPENTLYDVFDRKATIIDMGGILKVDDMNKFVKVDYCYYYTPSFTSPELTDKSKPVIDMKKSLAYSCGKVIEYITVNNKSEEHNDELNKLIQNLTCEKPKNRMSIEDAIIAI